MRGRAWLPGGRAGRDAGAAAEPLGLGLALVRPPAGAQSPSLLPGATTGHSSANQTRAATAPGHRRGPRGKGSASRSFPDSRHFIRGVQGLDVPSGETFPQERGPARRPAPHLRRCSEAAERRREKTFKSPVATELAGPDRTPQRLRRVAAAARRSPVRSGRRAA